jgi:multidrug efflux system outer membrane protein
MTRLLAALASSAALLAGCATLEPAYHRPASPVPAAFPTGPAYPAPADAPVADWRAVFPDSKLRAVIDQALVNSRDLRVAVAQIEAARAQYHVQRAALLPTVNASASASYGRQYTGLPASQGGAYSNETEYSASVGASSYVLDLFGRIRSLTKQALETYLATDQARRSTQIALIASVATDYLTLASDESLLEVSRQTVVSGQADLDLTTRRLQGGIGSALDVANAQTVVEQAHDDVARYTTLVAQDRNALDLVVGAPVAAENLPTGIDDPATRLADVPAALDSHVLLRRPDVLEAEHTLRAANANIGAARAAFFPSISLTGSGGSTTSAIGSLFAGGTGVWNFAPSVSVPIFDGGANKGNLDYARAEDRIDIAQYEKAIQTAFEEVANALAQRGTIAERLRAQQALVNAAAQSLRLSQALYARGSDSYLDVLTAQRTYYSAQQSFISVRLIASNNIVTLYQALGGGLADGDTPGTIRSDQHH